MRHAFLLLIPVILGLCGCGPESSRPAPPYREDAPRAAKAPAAEDLALSDDELDELDEIVDSLLEEDLESP